MDGTNGSIKSAQVAVADAFAKASPVQRADETLLKEYLRLELKRFIQSKTGSRPVITPVIQKV
jgi:mRNA degradation ribonuclease J1/J2